MALTLYGLKNCDTCTKARKALTAGGATVTFVDIRQEADLKALLPGWLEAVGPAALINKRSTSWRTLSEDERAKAEDEPLATLAANPTLIKRPVIDNDGAISVGWTKATAESFGV